MGDGVCPKVVAKGLRCIYSNQGFWYLDHLDTPWDKVYTAEPLEGIKNTSQQELVIGGEVCMWGETIDTSDVQQTIWPRAAAAAGISFTFQPSEISKIQNIVEHSGNLWFFLQLIWVRIMLDMILSSSEPYIGI